MELLDFLPGVPNFPKPGVIFRDISPLIANQQAFNFAVQGMSNLVSIEEYTHIVAIESRGFIFGAAMAFNLNKPLVLVRKANKLPLASHFEHYDLEYCSDSLEIQSTSFAENSRALLIDDVLATGGTMIAASNLVRKAGANVVAAITLLEIKMLKGGNLINCHGIHFQSLLSV